MRTRFLAAAVLAALAVVPWEARAGEPGPIGHRDSLLHDTLRVEEEGIRIERVGPGARVTVPVHSSGTDALEVRLSAHLASLTYESIAPITETVVSLVTLVPGLTEAQVLVPSVPEWNWVHPEGTVLVWSIDVGAEPGVLSGAKALGSSQPALRLLVALPPRLVSGRPVDFQATITLADGTAAAGAALRIRGGWFGGMQGAFAVDAGAQFLLFDGTADAMGVVSGQFASREAESRQWFAFEADLDGRQAAISEGLEFVAEAPEAGRVVITTDKPVYQPSQDVHVRVLTLRPSDRRPAVGEVLTHWVRDPKGTSVVREEIAVDPFGITHFTFPLADELLLGRYTVEVSGGGQSGVLPFTVDRYELPRFASTVELDSPYATPGGTLSGRVNVAYVFGEPVRGASVVVDLLRNADDVDAQDSDSMRTRADGTAEFELSVPPHFDRRDLREGTSQVHLRVRAVDRAEQAAETTRTVPVSDGPLTLRMVPESGALAIGVSNLVHVSVSDPGGRPVVADVTLSLAGGALGSATTDDRGYARILTAPIPAAGEILVTAVADQGARRSSQTFSFDPAASSGFLLARPDRSIVGVGEPLTLDLLCSESAAQVAVEFRSAGRTLESRLAVLSAGVAQVVFTPDAEALGELEISARTLGADGRLLQDRRTLVVDLGDDLAVAVVPDRPEYQPGDTGELALRVTSADGSGIVAEVGVTAVDEAVYLLTAGRAGTEALVGSGAGLDGTETFGGAPSLGDLLAGDPSPADQDLAAAILAERRRRSGVLDSRSTRALAERTAAQYRVGADGGRITARLRPGSRAERMRAIRSGRFVDPWGRSYEISIQGRPREVLVTSAGADEIPGTQDDLSYVFRVRRRHRNDPVRNRLVGFFDDFVSGGQERDVGPEILGAPVFDAAAAGPGGLNEDSGGGGGAPSTVTVRRFFPETLFAVPDLITGPDGSGILPFTLADNVTTWRVAALASSQDGRVGSGTAALQVRKEMFVDLGLPRDLTAGDALDVPVVAYNLTDVEREVAVQLADGDWFEPTAGVARQILVPPGSAARTSFGIRVLGTGDVALRVDASSGSLTDAVELPARVAPDARPVSFTRSGQLLAPVTETIHVPASALPGETSMQVHLLPGILSQTLDGLDALLAEPYGCFEQTTSTTYPNAVVLDYLQKSGTLDPEVAARANRYLTQGLQRLLTFEVDGGGFSLWGDAPASVILSGYALQEFEDIAKVRYVDPALIQRTAAWLVAQQESDGSWKPTTAGVHFGQSTDPLRVTAYVAWVLADSGRAPAALGAALGFVRNNIAGETDLYTRIVAANALLAADSGDPVGLSLLSALLSERTRDERGTYWEYGSSYDGRGLMSSSGHGADVETSAMMVQALLATGGHAEVVTDVLKFLAGARSEYGGWGGTYATVWTIKAFVGALPVSGGGGAGQVAIRVNGADAGTVAFDGRDAPVAVEVSDFVVTGDNTVGLVASGGVQPFYRISGRYVIPWSEPVREPESLSVDVSIGPRRLRAGRGASLNLEVRNRRAAGDAEQVTAMVALPPGFSADEASLRDLRAAGEIDRFEVRGGRINLYLGRIAHRATKSVAFRVNPTLRGEVTLPRTSAYEYYDPASRGSSPPRRYRVR